VIVAGQLVIVGATLTASPERASYNRAHGMLFIVSILAILVFFTIKGILATMLRHTWQTALRPGQATLPEVADALAVTSLLVALASLAFVVDLAFFRRGFTIGGSITVSLILLGKAFRERWRATRR
jgi:hypothetical protein